MDDNLILRPITILKERDDIKLSSFNCVPKNIEKYKNSVSDYELINDFLKTKALSYSEKNIMQTFLLISEKEKRVIVFFSLNAGSQRIFKKFRLKKKKQKFDVPTLNRNTELPTIDMVWMGIDNEYQHNGYGQKLMEQIFFVIGNISNVIGVSLFAVCAIKDSQSYFTKFGFIDVSEGIGNTKGDQFMAITIEELRIILK